MENLLNSENNFYYGSGETISCWIDLHPVQKIVTLGYDNGNRSYVKSYNFTDEKEVNKFANTIVKAIKKAKKNKSVVNFEFFNFVLLKYESIKEVERTQELRELLHS